MSILATILNTLVVILAVLLIALILVQPTKSGGGFGSAFGGLGESVFGAQAMSHLSRLTVWCISIFFILTLASAIVASHIRPSDKHSIAMDDAAGATPQTGAAPAAAAVPADEVANPAQDKKGAASDAAQNDQTAASDAAQDKQDEVENAAQDKQDEVENAAQNDQAAASDAAPVEQAQDSQN